MKTKREVFSIRLNQWEREALELIMEHRGLKNRSQCIQDLIRRGHERLPLSVRRNKTQ